MDDQVLPDHAYHEKSTDHGKCIFPSRYRDLLHEFPDDRPVQDRRDQKDQDAQPAVNDRGSYDAEILDDRAGTSGRDRTPDEDRTEDPEIDILRYIDDRQYICDHSEGDHTDFSFRDKKDQPRDQCRSGQGKKHGISRERISDQSGETELEDQCHDRQPQHSKHTCPHRLLKSFFFLYLLRLFYFLRLFCRIFFLRN